MVVLIAHVGVWAFLGVLVCLGAVIFPGGKSAGIFRGRFFEALSSRPEDQVDHHHEPDEDLEQGGANSESVEDPSAQVPLLPPGEQS